MPHDLVSEITEIATQMPLARKIQLYEFALFLKTHPLPAEDTYAEIIADESIWEEQFAATSDEKLASLVALVESEMMDGEVFPMFDKKGNFVEHT